MTTNESSTQEIETTSSEMTSMDMRQLHSSQQEAMKKIIEFSGESNELDIDEWLFDLTNLFTLMKLKDETKILETMGKLVGPALRWYQENLKSFTNWNDAERALRDRFKEFISDGQLMQEFFQIRQQENQSITSFYEEVMRKYRKAKKCVTEQQVITVLQTGVKHSLKEHLIRNENDIKKPGEWLQFAREEEHIQKRIQQQRHGLYEETTRQPYFEPRLPTATIQHNPSKIQPSGQQTKVQHHYNQEQNRQPHHLGNDSMQQQNRNRYTNNMQRRQAYPRNKTQETDACLICNRRNHSTIKCLYKKDNGCFKCGQSTHQIRDCPQHHFFE